MSLFANTHRFVAPLLVLFALTGCPEDDPPNVPIDAGGGISRDAGISGDTGDTADGGPIDAGDVVRNHRPSNAITAGGGKGSNENYKVRVLIGGPSAIGPGTGENNKINLGAGAAQHGK